MPLIIIVCWSHDFSVNDTDFTHWKESPMEMEVFILFIENCDVTARSRAYSAWEVGQEPASLLSYTKASRPRSSNVIPFKVWFVYCITSRCEEIAEPCSWIQVSSLVNLLLQRLNFVKNLGVAKNKLRICVELTRKRRLEEAWSEIQKSHCPGLFSPWLSYPWTHAWIDLHSVTHTQLTLHFMIRAVRCVRGHAFNLRWMFVCVCVCVCECVCVCASICAYM